MKTKIASREFMNDRFSDAFFSVAGYLLLMILARAVPVYGLFMSGQNLPGAIGGLLGAFTGILIAFFVAALLMRFQHRGEGRRTWMKSCKAACWFTFAFFIFISVAQKH